MELSDEILGYLLPRHQADDDGRHILVSSYTASLSLHALFLLHSKFQPVVIITNNATYLENRLWYGLPLQPATLYKPRAALEVRLNHDIDADKAREVYVVTGVEFLPHLIYMINGSNYTRVFEIPPTSSFLASMKTITLGFQIQDIFRDSPKFKKYFNAVKVCLLWTSKSPQNEKRFLTQCSHFSGIEKDAADHRRPDTYSASISSG